MQTLRHIVLTLLLALAWALPALPAHAGAFDEAQDEGFEHDSAVPDSDLSQMRGGFVDVNGLLINFSFFYNVSIDENLVHQAGFNLEDLLNGTGGPIPPTIIQNVNNDVLISIQNTLNLDVANANQWLSSQAYGDNAAFQNTLAIR